MNDQSNERRDIEAELQSLVIANSKRVTKADRALLNDVLSLLRARAAAVSMTSKQLDVMGLHLRDTAARLAALEVLVGISSIVDAPRRAQRMLDGILAETRQAGGQLAAPMMFD